jgi:4-hydroxybenzoate polyprenyltransferase
LPRGSAALTDSALCRFWIYQGERFPLFKNGLLIAAFAALFFFFLLLRIADEFKDAETDARYRPERPVPRGLVSLRELAVLGLAVAVLQGAAALAFHPPLLILLGVVWAYMGLMTVEFFASRWLHARLFFYMVSHMAIMPLIDFFATACDWLPATGRPPAGLVWFLALSFFNGLVIEIGRKTWASAMERAGVESYSSAWGIKRAIGAWSVALLCSAALALIVAMHIDFLLPVALVLGGLAILMLFTGWRFCQRESEKGAKAIENLSGLWVFANYLLLGIVPMGVKAWT